MTQEKLQTGADLEVAFVKYNEMLFRYAFIRLRDKAVAGDITQDVFIKAWKYKDSYDSEKSSLKNWLFVIITNLIRDYYRKNANKREQELDEELASDENIEITTEKKDTIQFVFKKIKYLSQREQELLILRYREDFTLREIAEMLEMKYSAVKVAVHRAIKKLQEICERENMTISKK